MNNKLLRERVVVLLEFIRRTADHYFSPETNTGQKGLYETLCGAGIWYLPSGVELYSGKISEEAYTQLLLHPLETKLVEEHSFPRKAGGRFLYELYQSDPEALTCEVFIDLYKSRLGKFNLVLKRENDRLKRYQRVGKDCRGEEFFRLITTIESTSYQSAGIELRDFSPDSYIGYKKERARKRVNTVEV